MPSRPEFKSCYQVEIIDDQNVILLAERGHRLLTGAAYGVLARLLDGSRTVDEILAAATEHVDAMEISYALQRLQQLGCIGERSTLPKRVAAFWDTLGVDAATAAQKSGLAGSRP